MDVLVVYFSRTGNTRGLAEDIAEWVEADLEEIVEKKDRSGFEGVTQARKDSLNKKSTEIEEMEKKISSYDIVIIGTPVWAGNIPPPVRSFLWEYKGDIHNPAFFVTSWTGDPGNTLNQMKSLLGRRPSATKVLSETQLVREHREKNLGDFIGSIEDIMDRYVLTE